MSLKDAQKIVNGLGGKLRGSRFIEGYKISFGDRIAFAETMEDAIEVAKAISSDL